MRALVSIFAGLLILISLYQLSFTWFVNKHEKSLDAKASAYIKKAYTAAAQKYPGDKEAQAAYQDSLNTYKAHYYDSLRSATKETKITWWGQTYQKAKESELLLGLDLQGGINVTMDVALDGLIKGLANNPKDPQITKAIEEAQRLKLTSDQNFINLFITAFKTVNPGAKLAPHFAKAGNKLSANATDEQVIAYIKGKANAAMAQTYEVLRTRIDKFGVAQPSISLDENKGIITVELAGASDPERVRKYLQSTANLQFWEVYTMNDGIIQNGFVNADKALEAYLYGTTAPKDSNVVVPDSLKGTTKADSIKSAADSALLASRSNPLFRVLNPARPYQQGGYPAYVGIAAIKDTGKVNQYLNIPAVKNNFPGNVKFVWGKQERDDNGKASEILTLFAIKTIPGKEGAQLEGTAIEDARQEFDQTTNEVLVTMDMNDAGARLWSSMTERNIGKPIAIVLDDIVYTAPNVNQKIDGGRSRITMGASNAKNRALVVEEAQDIANILKSGKVEAAAKIVQEQVVGPTLGDEAVHGGIMSFSISFAVIFLLMLVYYNTAGIIANIALILNLLFTVGVLSAMGATLTAPGIAGLVLTIGMAVDTNVIIFERIKDELAHGKSHEQAIKDGYRRSLPPVLDAHITTLLTAIILAIYGLGPVLGFATTQIIGILLSLFCGILVSRLITDFYTNKNRHFKYFTGLSKRIFQHASYPFIKFRKVAYGITVVVLILGVAAIFNGFDEGVEFKGGRSYVVNFGKPIDEEKVREALDKTFHKAPLIKTYGSPNKLEITTDFRINEEGLSIDSAVRNTLFSGLKPLLPANLTAEEFATTKWVEGTKKVDPTISDDLKSGAQWATFWSLLIIAIYIFIRFRDWRYSLGTIVALLHDVLVTLAVFSFLKGVVPFPLEIDQHFIAAILTVIGFSMNDTVIVYDRVREYSHTMKGMNKETLINKAINDTLSRTIMTSLTVFLTIFILFLVGGEVTKGFAFAMLIGVVTGTYSSIFVAAPMLVDLAKNKPLGEADAKPGATAPAVKAKAPAATAKKA
ncbi:protein translocase subunit SecDF [Paraflavitalea soli]|uniref:Multifunctional fusion protein n=1 Tax=Paraflavitalea soli TaxID=2315862 RepID=A0A3B7MJJ2_9BACT|nr:protein translocase subunit SecDF [Paraflavitalea soli]AXY73409.1 protein translocase subunit SecDF [Paraflavitalea soli]